jgi:N-acetylglucosaminyldiphosphoundecaprenol N-acetyl-beta-D-mannosaminyltransferase
MDNVNERQAILNRGRSVNFNGIDVQAITYDEMIQKIDSWLKNKTGRSHHIACINAYCVTLAMRDKRLAKIYNGADIRGPDGMPFVKWIKRNREIDCDRLAAPDIALELAKRSKDKGYKFYLYGGTKEVVEKMKHFLEERFPYINIVGYRSPPFRPLTEEEDKEIINEINNLSPDIILVGLGTPKQDYWIDEHLESIRGAVLIASGATFDFFGGRIKMAPYWIRQSGFEWGYRLFSKDFSRLWTRYTVMNAIFLWHFMLQIMGVRVRTPNVWSRSDFS